MSLHLLNVEQYLMNARTLNPNFAFQDQQNAQSITPPPTQRRVFPYLKVTDVHCDVPIRNSVCTQYRPPQETLLAIINIKHTSDSIYDERRLSSGTAMEREIRVQSAGVHQVLLDVQQM